MKVYIVIGKTWNGYETNMYVEKIFLNEGTAREWVSVNKNNPEFAYTDFYIQGRTVCEE